MPSCPQRIEVTDFQPPDLARIAPALTHARAEQDHLEAAEAHEGAMEAPLDDRIAGAALRASSIADQASQKVGVRPLRPWPKR